MQSNQIVIKNQVIEAIVDKEDFKMKANVKKGVGYVNKIGLDLI